MLAFFLRYRTGFTYLAIVILSLSMIASQVPAEKETSVLAWALFAVISPIQQTFSYIIVGARDLWDDYIDLRSAHEENKALRAELSRLSRENQRLQETLSIAGDLQELYLFQVDRAGTFIPLPAMVIGAGADYTSHTLLLNRGSLDGVEITQGVICPRGVVGKVVKVGPTSCLVQLLTDPRFAMAARVQDSRTRGALRGSAGEVIELLLHGTGAPSGHLMFSRDTDPIKTGDRVVSSGIEGIFPAGVLVGFVVEVQEGQPPFRTVRVLPGANLRSLEWVQIIRREGGERLEEPGR